MEKAGKTCGKKITEVHIKTIKIKIYFVSKVIKIKIWVLKSYVFKKNQECKSSFPTIDLIINLCI